MDDAFLVRRAVAGDLDCFGQLYDRYFNRIYDFSWRILRDADEAADVTQDVFMKAMQNLGGLSKAASFKSWLFSIAHNTAVTRAERAGRTVPLPAPVHEEAFGTFDVPDPSRLDNPEVVAQDHELAALVWEAATALNPRDYALLDMHVRQGLESAEIAEVMGVSKGNAYTMVSRMKQAAGDVFASYMVARRGSKDCDELQRVLAQYVFPPYNDDIRRAVDTHVDGCEVCQRTRRGLIAPMEVFSSFAAIPAPFVLKADLWRDISAAWPYGAPASAAGAGNGAASTAAAGGAGAAGPPTSPVYGGEEDSNNRIVLFAVAALGMLLFAFVVAAAVVLAGNIGDDDEGGSGGGDTPDATSTVEGSPEGEESPTPPVIVETNTPGPTDTPAPTETVTETPTPAPTTPTPPPEPTDTPEPEPTEPPNGEPTGLPPIPTQPPGG